MTTRRTAQRQFLLRPSRTTNEIVRFCLGRSMELYPVSMHVFAVLSNHYHMEFTDDHGHMPEFMRYFNQAVARHMNASLGRWENFWASGSYSAVRLMTPQDIVDKAAYILANPVAAGLVERSGDWPGVWSHLEDGEVGHAVGRPVGFFRPEGPVPEECVIRLTTPPGFASWDEFLAAVRPELERREEEARQLVRQDGRTFLGVAGVKRQRPTDRPTTQEPRRRLNPRIAARDAFVRIHALKQLKAFWQAYRRVAAPTAEDRQRWQGADRQG